MSSSSLAGKAGRPTSAWTLAPVGEGTTVFQGSLQDMPVDALLQTLDVSRADARIRIQTMRHWGTIRVAAGKPAHAEFGRADGVEALYRILGVDDGLFRVDFGASTGRVTIEGSLTGILLEGARRRDHIHRLRADLPEDDARLERGTARVPLSAEEHAMVLRCDGSKTLADLVDAAPDALALYERLHALARVGAIRAKPKAAPPTAENPPRAETPNTDSVPLGDESSGGRLPTRRIGVGAAVGLAACSLAAALSLVLPGDHESTTPIRVGVPEPTPSPETPVVVASADDETTCPDAMVLLSGGRASGEDAAGRADTSSGSHEELAAFCVDVHEVTVAAYRECVELGMCERAYRESHWPQGKTSKSAWKRERAAYSELCNAAEPGRELHPANCVRWKQADSYCRWAGKALPTDEQWELAARGIEARRYAWGAGELDETRANFCDTECRAWRRQHRIARGGMMFDRSDGFAGTAPVGSYPEGATEAGVFDLAGNVFEWTADRADPQGEGGAPRYGVRGGAFHTAVSEFAEAGQPASEDADAHTPGLGFRCVAEPH